MQDLFDMLSQILAVHWYLTLQCGLEKRELVVDMPQCGRADQSGQLYVARECDRLKCAEFCTVRTKLFLAVRSVPVL